MSERASLEELLEFANAVREAGGGNPLDALMPAVPGNPNQCLIAKNLNFNCEVDGLKRTDRERLEEAGHTDFGSWAMRLEDKDIRDRIAQRLNLISLDNEDGYLIVLPSEIGQVAEDYDEWNYVFEHYSDKVVTEIDYDYIDRLEFLPYVHESIKEAYDLTAVINETAALFDSMDNK